MLSVIYALRMVQLSMFGPNEDNWSLSDLNVREVVVLACMALVIFQLGLYPQPVFNTARLAMMTVEDTIAGRTGP